VTLILACLSHQRIVVAADRRLTLPDGSLYDDDANKAIFYEGRIALAYTGLARLDGADTADWLAARLAQHDTIEAAMESVASEASQALTQATASDKRVAFLAFGWATLQAQPPPRPFACVATNFMSTQGTWLNHAQPTVTVRTWFLDQTASHYLVVAGQHLYKQEYVVLSRFLRKCVEHRASPGPFARLLGTQIQLIAGGSDARASSVGRGLIIQSLTKDAVLIGEAMIVTPLAPTGHSFVYVRHDGSLTPFESPILVGGGGVLKGGGQALGPGVKSLFDNP
jgi:hypothetical protein